MIESCCSDMLTAVAEVPPAYGFPGSGKKSGGEREEAVGKKMSDEFFIEEEEGEGEVLTESSSIGPPSPASSSIGENSSSEAGEKGEEEEEVESKLKEEVGLGCLDALEDSLPIKFQPRRMSRTIYVGNLPGDIREKEVEDLFYKFEDPRDSEDAVAVRDDYNFNEHRLRVEPAHGGRGGSSYDRSSSCGGGGRRGVSRHSEYRVLVTGLPSSTSWQDLKDHMRRAGDVCFAEVYREGSATGIVDCTNHDDMKYVIKKLNESEFKNAFSRGVVRVNLFPE